MKHTWMTKNDTSPGFWDGHPDIGNEVDVCARDADDPHNGPKCKDCGFNFCEHCSPECWDDDNCGNVKVPADGPAMTEDEFRAVTALLRPVGW